jgi:hypothetical protein
VHSATKNNRAKGILPKETLMVIAMAISWIVIETGYLFCVQGVIYWRQKQMRCGLIGGMAGATGT